MSSVKKVISLFSIVLFMIVSCDDNKNKNSNNQPLPPNQFVLFGDLLFNQKEDGSRQSAYFLR
jgi:hypothetical protein